MKRSRCYLQLLLLLLALLKVEAKSISCEFNRLCVCQNYTAQYIDITCHNVPVVGVPSGVGHYTNIYRLRVIGARELVHLDKDSVRSLHSLASLTISKSRLSYVERDTFAATSVRHTLASLELSYAQLSEVPAEALRPLSNLQWLSLRGNQIETLKGASSTLLAPLAELRVLHLNENFLSLIEDRTFQSLAKLELLDLSHNVIERIEGNPFPASVRSLHLAHCLLRKIPFEAVGNLVGLRALHLQGNLISHLSTFKLPVRRIETIDLSHNLIATLPLNLFAHYRLLLNYNNTNNSSTAREESELIEILKLHLDFNFIQSLPDNLFKLVSIVRLTVSNNRLSSGHIGPDAFRGALAGRLAHLDLSYNLIDSYPAALKQLRALRTILLKNNRIQALEGDAFAGSAATLEAIDLSHNSLTAMPAEALRVLANLIKLNLHDNLIERVDTVHLTAWCRQCKSLLLSKNRLTSLHPHSFGACPQLTELRLGGNKLLELDSLAIFAHLGAAQLLDLSTLRNGQRFFERPPPPTANVSDTSVVLPQAKWLQFNFNHLESIPAQLIESVPSIRYLDLQNNVISVLPRNLTNLGNLTTLILSHNNLTALAEDTFADMQHLESIAIYFNKITNIGERAFRDLPRLQSLILSKNQLSRLEPAAFVNLSADSGSLTLMLDDNQLRCLSIQTFEHMFTSADCSLYLNISNNQLTSFANCQQQQQQHEPPKMKMTSGVPIRIIDLSHNQLEHFAIDFLNDFCPTLLSLFATSNRLRSLSIKFLNSCSQLQTLSLGFNQLTHLAEDEDEDADADLCHSPLQILNLQHNQIGRLHSSLPFFRCLVALTSLDLSENRLQTLPANAFNRTRLLRLVLSRNHLQSVFDHPDDHCLGVGDTLRHLDLAHNALTTLPGRLVACTKLVELNVAHNRIYTLHLNADLSSKLRQLHTLDLAHNPLEDGRMGFTFVSNHSMLYSLKLSSVGIAHLDEMNIPYLYSLDLSSNKIRAISSKIFSRSRNVRRLDVSRNQLLEVPKHLWKYMTRLVHLALHHNPIEILDPTSFAGLKYLRHLDIRNLKLQLIDSRIFLYQSQLSTLKISTYPYIRSFRLQDILAKSDALQTIVVDVKEAILSHQIQWAFGGKIKELVITGGNLVQILPDAFLGLNNANDLILRVTDTSIRQLPDGLLRYLADIRYITIDLKGNQLRTLRPSVLFTGFEQNAWQSRQLLGGIILQDNPLVCDCNLLWLSKWMRDMFTEMKSENIDRAIHAKATLALSRCSLGGNRSAGVTTVPIIHLAEEDIDCNNHSGTLQLSFTYLLIMIVLVILL